MEAKAIPSGYRQCEGCYSLHAYYSMFLLAEKLYCGKCCIKRMENRK
jgi:hypothetical protein